MYCIFFLCIFCRINGSIPSNAEIRDNILTFKGPVTYDVQGTYVCDATNSIGTRSASVEISIIGTFTWSFSQKEQHTATITSSTTATAVTKTVLE